MAVAPRRNVELGGERVCEIGVVWEGRGGSGGAAMGGAGEAPDVQASAEGDLQEPHRRQEGGRRRRPPGAGPEAAVGEARRRRRRRS